MSMTAAPNGCDFPDEILFTGAEDGILVWRVLDPEAADQFGDNLDKIHSPIGVIDEHGDEPVWSLDFHKQSPLLLSASSDETIKLHQVHLDESGAFSSEVVKEFVHRTQDGIEMPTSLTWVNSQINTFLATYSRALLCSFDYMTGKITNTMKITTEENLSYV